MCNDGNHPSEARHGQTKQSHYRQRQAKPGRGKQPQTSQYKPGGRRSPTERLPVLYRLDSLKLPKPAKPIKQAPPPPHTPLTHSPKPSCHLYALMLIDDTRGQLPPGWVPHAVAGVSAVPTIDDIHRHAWLSRSNTMAIYDDVVNRPLGGWIQRLVWCPTGDCSGGFRKRSTCDTTEVLFRSGTLGTLSTTTDWVPPCCVERPRVQRWKPSKRR